MLQEFILIPLDIFRQYMQNKNIETPLEAWLTFLSEDDPAKIIRLITQYPEFGSMYDTIYGLCRNMEKLMGFFSEELRILDRNTVRYMIEEQQRALEEQKRELEEQQKELEEQQQELEMEKAKNAALEKELVLLRQQLEQN